MDPSLPGRRRRSPPPWQARVQALRGLPLNRVPLAMLIACLLGGLGIVQVSFLLVQEGYRAALWSSQARAERAEIARLRGDIAVLGSVRDHQDDPAYLGELARCQGFVAGGERVVVDPQARVPEAGNCDIVPLP